METKTIEIIRGDDNKIIEIKGIPCLNCESLNTHTYKDCFFCLDCKARIKKEKEEELKSARPKFSTPYQHYPKSFL